MTLTETKAFKEELRSCINNVCEPKGFVYSDDYMWERKWAWKTDRIHAIPRQLGIIVNFDVILPPMPESEMDFQLLFFENLGQIAGRSSNYEYTKVFEHNTFDRGTIATDLENELSWFSQFDNPNDCLTHLFAGDKNQESKAFKYCEEYLNSRARVK